MFESAKKKISSHDIIMIKRNQMADSVTVDDSHKTVPAFTILYKLKQNKMK